MDYTLIVRDAPKSPAAEAIRTIRTNLQFAAMDRPLRTVMVTSAGPGEGKTAISTNLAASIAMSGVETIVVGIDLRKPTAHLPFGLPSEPGVTNVLLGGTSLDDALHESGVSNLKVLPAGPVPPNPAEVIGSEAMSNLIEELKARAEIIVFDVTPVLAVTDAVLLSRKMDGVLLVVALKKTPRELVRRASDALRQARANLIGVVANWSDDSSRGRGAYYYQYYSEEASATNKQAFRKFKFKTRHWPNGVISRIFNKASN